MPLALVLASHDAVSILNVTTIFLISIHSKLDVTWVFPSCDKIATATGIT